MKFDAVNFMILEIPPYIFFAGIGALLGVLLFNILALKKNVDIKRANRYLLISFPILLLGAKMMGIFYNLLDCLKYSRAVDLDTFLNSGIVFYGGLLSFTAFHFLVSKRFDEVLRVKYLDILSVCIPLFHAFGRIGCFTGGCCYGIKKKSFLSVYYSVYTPDGISYDWRIPIQLIESAADLILVGVLLTLLLKRRMRGRLYFLYLLSYGCIRFVNEFFRGDWDRDLLFGVSCSQIVSIAVVLVAAYCVLNYRSFASGINEKNL